MKKVIALCHALLFVCFAPALLSAEDAKQPGSDTAKIDEMLRELKVNPPDQRSRQRDKILRLVPQGEKARILMSRCEADLRKENTEPDKNYLVQLILLVSERGERTADKTLTDTLLKLLASKSFAIRYVAEKALGDLWKNAGKQATVSDKCKEVSTELIGLLSLDIQDPEVQAIAYALFNINPIPPLKKVNPITKQMEDAEYFEVPVDKLRLHLEEWSRSEEGSKLLLPLERRKPLDILTVMDKSRRQAERLKAKNVLMDKKPLVCVDKILTILPEAVKGNDLVKRDDMATLLGAITEVPLDLKSANTPQAVTLQLRKWDREFQDYMSKKKTPRMRQYIVQKLVEEVTRMTGMDALKIERLRWILLRNVDKADELPKNLPESIYKRMIEKPLIRKGEIAKSVETIKTTSGGDKILAINRIRTRLLQTEEDKKLAQLYVPELVKILKEERRRRLITALRELLRDITGYPILAIEDLSMPDRTPVIDAWYREVREKLLDKWLDDVHVRR